MPTYGTAVQILPRAAYETIRTHSLSRLAAFLHSAEIQLRFDPRYGFGGYLIQGDMIERILREVFPDSYRPLDPSRPIHEVHITLYDTALNEYSWKPLEKNPAWTDPTLLEMSRVKAGNPLLPAVTREAVRREMNIPENARVLHVYLNHNQMETLEALHRAAPNLPDYIILSFNKSFASLDEIRRITGYEIGKLSNRIRSENKRYILLNDLRYRMMDLHVAADYAFILGANNLFEPLRARCPTLFFKNSWRDWIPGLASPVAYYHPTEWNRVAALAEKTGGAIGITSTGQARSALLRLGQIRSESISHPAFTPLIPGGPTPFEELLDALEADVRAQLRSLEIPTFEDF